MTNPTPLVEKIARALHGKLFATITDWRDELCEWDDLPDHAKSAFLYSAQAALSSLDDVVGVLRQASEDLRAAHSEVELNIREFDGGELHCSRYSASTDTIAALIQQLTGEQG